MYLVGCNKHIIKFTNDNVVINVGGGYEVFAEYIPEHEMFYQQKLLTEMINTRESLEWICDGIMNDRRPQSKFNQYEQLDMQFDEPNSLQIVRRQTNRKAVFERRKSLTNAGVRKSIGKTSTSPVRKSLTGGTPNKFGSPGRRGSSPTRDSPNRGFYDSNADKRKYISTDFK